MSSISRRTALAGLAVTAAGPAAASGVSPGLESLIAAHAAALRIFNAAIDVTGDMEEHARDDKEALRAVWASEAFKVASEAEAVAGHREEAAGVAIIAYPCRTVADVIRKAAYMASVPTIMKGGRRGQIRGAGGIAPGGEVMTGADPLATAVADFRASWGAYCALPDDQCTPAANHPWRAAWARLRSAPTPTSPQGAPAAVSLVLEETAPDSTSPLDPELRGLLVAVQRYLEAA
jgi:hypothetical protein